MTRELVDAPASPASVAGTRSAARGGWLQHESVQAFLYVDGTGQLVPLGFLAAGGYSEARGVNTALQVVGTARALPGVAHAFLWQNGVMRDLNDLLVLAPAELDHLTSAAAVNDQGTIAAEARLRDGRTGVAVLRPIP